jgi:hypothetical protein
MQDPGALRGRETSHRAGVSMQSKQRVFEASTSSFVRMISVTPRIPGLLMLSLAVLTGGCLGARDGEERQTRARPATDQVLVAGPDVRAPIGPVGLIQLYPGSDESRIPVYAMGTPDRLTLRFDLLEDRGRPLSVYFYHADQNWRRDLAPAEFLNTFQRDDILDYRSSEGTDVRYVHYQYRFPNDALQFRLSGNYIIRVTEQGMEDDVLFERPFFVSEQAVSTEFATDYVLGGGAGFSATQPILLFTPPGAAQASPYDFSVCFARNGQFGQSRCATRPSMLDAPSVRFYLPPEASFAAEPADYFLDLGSLQVGRGIERVDYEGQTIAVRLEPDYVRFAGTGLEPLQNGQAVVQSAVRDRANPEVGAQYVDVLFSLIPPDGIPFGQDVHVVGAFNHWRSSAANRMNWNGVEGRYEATIRMKQGRYEYRYVSRDGRLRAQSAGSAARAENLYQAFIYFNDLSVGTQRLLAVSGITAR